MSCVGSSVTLILHFCHCFVALSLSIFYARLLLPHNWALLLLFRLAFFFFLKSIWLYSHLVWKGLINYQYWLLAQKGGLWRGRWWYNWESTLASAKRNGGGSIKEQKINRASAAKPLVWLRTWLESGGVSNQMERPVTFALSVEIILWFAECKCAEDVWWLTNVVGFIFWLCRQIFDYHIEKKLFFFQNNVKKYI